MPEHAAEPADEAAVTIFDEAFAEALNSREEAVLEEGWYAVTGEPVLQTKLSIRGPVNLILTDQSSLYLPLSFEIESTGTLTVWACSTDPEVMGSLRFETQNESRGAVTINGGKIDGTSHSGTAMYLTGDLTINDGMISLTGETAGLVTSNPGAQDSDVTVNGGVLKGTGRLSGILVRGTLRLTGGTVEGYAGEDVNEDFFAAVDAERGLYVSGGLLKGVGGRAGVKSYEMNISGGTVIGCGDSVYGLYASTGGEMTGGLILGKGSYGIACNGEIRASDCTLILLGTEAGFRDSWQADETCFVLADPYTAPMEGSVPGILFETPSAGKLTADSFTLPADAVIPEGYTLTIAEGQTLAIPQGRTLYNEGELVNDGVVSMAEDVTPEELIALGLTGEGVAKLGDQEYFHDGFKRIDGGDITTDGLTLYEDAPDGRAVYTAGEGTLTFTPAMGDRPAKIILDHVTIEEEPYHEAALRITDETDTRGIQEIEIELVGENRVDCIQGKTIRFTGDGSLDVANRLGAAELTGNLENINALWLKISSTVTEARTEMKMDLTTIGDVIYSFSGEHTIGSFSNPIMSVQWSLWIPEGTGQIMVCVGRVGEVEEPEYSYWPNSYSYQLDWDPAGGTILGDPYTESGLVKLGAEVTPPEVSREGYRFVGWMPELTGTMPDGDTTYTAEWEKLRQPEPEPQPEPQPQPQPEPDPRRPPRRRLLQDHRLGHCGPQRQSGGDRSRHLSLHPGYQGLRPVSGRLDPLQRHEGRPQRLVLQGAARSVH